MKLSTFGFLLLCSVVWVTVASAQALEAESGTASASLNSLQLWSATLKEGGVMALIQLGLSAFGGAFVLERFFNLRRARLVPVGLALKARALWKERKFAELEALAETNPSTLGRIISFIVAHRENPVADVSAMTGDLIGNEIEGHQQQAYPLGVIATLQPLLGLLGMIYGMIETFHKVSLQGGALGDPTQLAAGISHALVTTGLGLALAIPFLALFHYFQSQTNRYNLQLEKEATALMTEWLMKKSDAR
jgi:biopolymer transport protein ExbB